MNIWLNKSPRSSPHLNLNATSINLRSETNDKRPTSLFHRMKQWFDLIHPPPHDHTRQVRTSKLMHVSHIPFVIPRQIEDVRKQSRPNVERAKLNILRMDEYLASWNEQSQAEQHRFDAAQLGVQALGDATSYILRLAFREVLSVDETLPSSVETTSTEENPSMDEFFRQTEKIDPITGFQQAQDLVEFEDALTKHRSNTSRKPTNKPSDMNYLKFCLLLEVQRDEHESCLRIFLHDIIFKFHLSDFRLRCEIHVRKPLEQQLVLEKLVDDSHLQSNYSAELVLWSGDWITEQEVELYVVLKIESLSINKYISGKFWDMAHLYVKNVPHGASRIFLREMTPVSRPHKILSQAAHVGQVELEAAHWPSRHELLIHVIKVSHSQVDRLLRAPETYVEIVCQSPFDIYDTQRTRVADRSLNPVFDEEFLFRIPDKVAVGDITVDLIFLEKSSLHHHPIVLGVLTLSKHTDWFPVRRFWTDLGNNPDIRLKDRFLFEGNIYD